MHILSFDVGVKNISYTFMRIDSITDWEIIYWDVFNIHGIVIHESFESFEEIADKDADEKNEKTKNKKQKNKKQIVKYDESNYEFIKSTYKNKNIKELRIIIEKIEKIESDACCYDNKKKCIEKLELFFKKNNIKEVSNVNEIIRRICFFFDSIFSDLFLGKYPLDAVIIENQPCLKNPKMKTIQIGLSTYFTMRLHVDSDKFSNTGVNFISASSKLNFCKKAKLVKEVPNTYKERKEISIQVVQNLMIDMNTNLEKIEKVVKKWEKWESGKKRDDLSDVVLQAFAYHSSSSKCV